MISKCGIPSLPEKSALPSSRRSLCAAHVQHPADQVHRVDLQREQDRHPHQDDGEGGQGQRCRTPDARQERRGGALWNGRLGCGQQGAARLHRDLMAKMPTVQTNRRGIEVDGMWLPSCVLPRR